MRVEVVRPSDLGPSERAVWKTLQGADPALRGPYFDIGWCDLVEAARGDVRIALALEGGRPIAFLPFQAASSLALPVGGSMSDYQGLIGALPEGASLADLVRGAGLARYDYFHGLAALAEVSNGGRKPHVAWVCDIERGFEAYTQDKRAQGSGVLKRTRQKRNKLEREFGPITIETYSADETAFQRLLGWKRSQYIRTGQMDVLGRAWAREVLMRAFAARSGDFGGAMFVLRAGDRLAAVNFCLRSPAVIHAWFIAHDSDLNEVSPGMILFVDMLQMLAADGKAELDLGYGDQRFKSELASVQRPLSAGFAAGAPASGAFRAAQYVVSERASRLPLGPAALLPSRVMGRYDFMRGLAQPKRVDN